MERAAAGVLAHPDSKSMQSGFDFTTLIFLALAIFVAWKLRSVLGTKTGAEQPPGEIFRRREESAAEPRSEGNVIRLPGAANDAGRSPERWAGIAKAGTPVAAALDAVAAQEPGFDARVFLEGAKAAYEMIVVAFAQGDRKTLKPLLSREVFENFDQDIAERETRGETTETTFVSLDSAEIVSAEVKGRNAQLTLHFASKLITATRDASGKVVDGNPDVVTDMTDDWTFARQLGARDPNWQLVAT
jgi:predicted lipid-binding transport protein (Tim44 family)